MTRFIGIDLAWQSNKNNTGISVLQDVAHSLDLIHYSMGGITTLQGVVDYVDTYATDNTVIAVDAPLIIRNRAGQRPCETEIGRRFGKFHASAHSSNLSRYPDAGSVQLVQLLGKLGFEHHPQPASDRRRPGRWIFEVYPHPAQIVLFDLCQIIKYKKGHVSQKREGLQTLRRHIRGRMILGTPSVRLDAKLSAFLDKDLGDLKGNPLKTYEDALDGLFCAYLAAFYWYWGIECNEMIGDLQTGYIINPTRALPACIGSEAGQ